MVVSHGPARIYQSHSSHGVSQCRTFARLGGDCFEMITSCVGGLYGGLDQVQNILLALFHFLLIAHCRCQTPPT